MSRFRKIEKLPALLLFPLLVFLFSQSLGQSLLRISAKDEPDSSRVVISSSFPLNYSLEMRANFLQVTIETKTSFRFQSDPVRSRLIKSFGWAKGTDFYILTIETKISPFRYQAFTVKQPHQLVIDFFPMEKEEKEKIPLPPEGKKAATEKEEVPEVPADIPSRPLRAETPSSKLIKTVVIDPGHGGLESGAKGKFGALEKDISLAVGLKLKAVIERSLAFRVVMTRDKDVDVSLENRAALANNNKADVFISIHANSSFRKNARGSETFFLSLNATDEEARRLAYLENSSAEFEEKLKEGDQDEIKMILWDMAQSAYLKQSSQLAEIIQKELNFLLGTANRGIKQAPFKVLTGVASPAVLVEVAFISNPEEEKKLGEEEFQNNVAQAIYRGLVNYLKLYS